MTNLTNQDIQIAKAEGLYRRAGQLAALLGQDNYYGAHIGMHSSMDHAKSLFRTGYDEVHFYLTNGDVDAARR